MNKKRSKNYDRVMSRVVSDSRTSFASKSHVLRHEVPSSVRVGGKPSVSYVSSSVFSELPTVLNDFVPEDSEKRVESSVKMSRVVKPRRTLKSLDTSKSPPRTVTKSRTMPMPRRMRAEESAPVLQGDEEWSDSHVRQCYSSRSHTRLKDLKDEIKAYHETEKFMRWRSHMYEKCGVVFDEDGGVASDKAVQADVTKAFECKMEWTKLRNAYIHALIRRKRNDKQYPEWKFEREMSFLIPFLGSKYQENIPKAKPNATDEPNVNVSTADESSSGDNQSEDKELLEADMEMSINDPVHVKEERHTPVSFEFSSEPTSEVEDSEQEELALALLNYFKKTEQRDPMDMFFLSMAKTVKKLPQIEQIRLKARIFEVVNNAEIKFYSEQEQNEKLN